MLKKSLSFILAFTLLICSTFIVNASNENDQLKNFFTNQNAAYEYYNIIKELYKTNFGKEYADNFAGAYLDKEGNLNINLVEDMSAVGYNDIELKAFIKDERVKYNKVKYSFNHLNNIISNLNDKMIALDISAIERDDQNNKVNIYVNDLVDKKISKIREIVDSNAIEFKQQVNKITTTVSNVVNGSSYTMPDGSRGATIGFGATKSDGTKGYIISGHIPYSVGTNISYAGTVIGSITTKVFSGSVDASFVTKSGSTYQPSRELNSFPYISESYSSSLPAMYTYLQNTVVYCWGAASGKQYGQILMSSFSFPINGQNLTDMVKSSYKAIQGDSGAPICITGSNSSYILAGTQCASSLDRDGNWNSASYSIFTKVNNILSTLGCTSNP